ncbi:hypothetical protein Q5752_000700 [Cryptotrichosporon argae]
MNAQQGAGALPNTSASQYSPASSALYVPAAAHNARVLSSIATLAACFSGLVAGLLGLTNLSGFALYLSASLLSALSTFALKCHGDVGAHVPQAHAGAGPLGAARVSRVRGWAGLMGLGQENLLGFLLFWIGSYALIHVYD